MGLQLFILINIIAAEGRLDNDYDGDVGDVGNDDDDYEDIKLNFLLSVEWSPDSRRDRWR